jgi:hypothetical protein
MFKRLAGVTWTPIGFVLLIAGLRMKPRARNERVLYIWLLALVLYLLIVPEGNRTLMYYQLPFVPIGALFIGKSLGRFWDGETRLNLRFKNRQASFALVILVLGVFAATAAAFVLPLFTPDPLYVDQFKIGQEVDRLIPKDALLAISDIDDNADAVYRTQSPTLLYYCDRKGWQLLPREIDEPGRMSLLKSRGARYFLVLKSIDYSPEQVTVTMLLLDQNQKLISTIEQTAPRR